MLSSADWWESMERIEALQMWERAGKKTAFERSSYYKDAREMFKRANEESRDKEFIEGMVMVMP